MQRIHPSAAVRSSDGLPAALSSKLDGVCTAGDPVVREMLESFRETSSESDESPAAGRVTRIDLDAGPATPLETVIAVGASLTSVPNPLAPHKVLGYVKVASVRLDTRQVAQLTSPVVNPQSVARLLHDHAHAQSAVLPMGAVRVPGKTLLQTLRHVLHATFEHFEGGALYDTLEYLVSCGWDEGAEPWRQGSKLRPSFPCPLCEGHVAFPRRCRRFTCRSCGAVLTLVDYLGLLTDATEATSDSAVAMNLKGVLEHLTVLTLLRRLVDSGAGAKYAPERVLVLKDGPLMLRGQSTRLVGAIRAYLRHLDASGVRFHLAGVDREGSFVNHCGQVEPWLAGAGAGAGPGAVFVPDNRYVLERIKHAGAASAVYGRRGLYASKVFCRADERTTLVLSVPNRRHGFDDFAHDPAAEDLVGLAPMLGTLKGLLSRHFPNTPLPLVATDRLCDLPNYPYHSLPGGLERLTLSVE
jgi:hypothetical protein